MGFPARGYSLADLRVLLDYDPETGVFTWRCQSGNRVKIGERAGSYHKASGYRLLSVGGVLYREHRLAWQYMHGTPPSGSIDHINGIKDDNRICNLRDTLHIENMQNRRGANKNNKSGFIGVGVYQGLYRARINVGGKQIYLGSFPTAEEASAVYRQKKLELHIK